MSQKVVLVTGAAGGIGRSICHCFGDRGWKVIASDLYQTIDFKVDRYLPMELDLFATDDDYRRDILESLQSELSGGFQCLVNNAAYQTVARVEELSAGDWHKTLNINLVSPFLLVKELLKLLHLGHGSVINIGSIHAHLTKPGFTAYSTSKLALEGLTRALAVEIGGRVRVNAIAPAAISTPMLEASFLSKKDKLSLLRDYHPSKCIGSVTDVAEMAIYLAENGSRFLNGAVVNLDGGISSRLHDPG